MKKLILLLALLPFFAFGQKVKSQNGSETGELKELTGNYCIVSFGKPFVAVVQVQTDEQTWEFIDPDSIKKIKFPTATSLLNFMDKNGWMYLNSYGDNLEFFIFKRKEKNKEQ